MKLAGLINICCGFVLVLTPSNWADILKDFIRLEQEMMELPHERLLEGGAGVPIKQPTATAPLSRRTFGQDSSDPDYGVRLAK